MISVSCKFVADIAGTPVLYGGTGRDHYIDVCQIFGFPHGIYDGVIHGHLVPVVIGESVMTGVLCISPCLMKQKFNFRVTC